MHTEINSYGTGAISGHTAAGLPGIMAHGESTPPQSSLDKPFHQLTEDDISQLTREDCRRYLKDKGMRRPSWNKSQAIQQVISLKKLLDPTPDSEFGDIGVARKKPNLSRPEIPHRVTLASDVPQKRARDDARILLSAVEDSVSYQGQDPPVAESGDCPASHASIAASPDIVSVSPRIPVAHGHAGQMTIFYCGKINVYDDIPPEKAHMIMQLAANKLQFSLESSWERYTTLGSNQSPSCKVASGSPGTVFTALNTGISPMQKEAIYISREDNREGASSKKAALQRYREKRNDRLKRRLGMPASTSFDVYVHHRSEDRSLNEQLIRSNTCSPSQPKLADLNYRDDDDR